MITLQACPKGYTKDQDKTVSPACTVERVKAKLAEKNMNILSATRRIDTGRLDIPVFLSVCGRDAMQIMPTHKQMGKGASPEQAEASALMELMERYAFFSFWERAPQMFRATWSEAVARVGEKILPIDYILQSVNETMPHADAVRLMDSVHWQFYPVTELLTGKEYYAPLDWFKTLNEFNGASAGNSAEESILQGGSELVERHVCCLIDREKRVCPTIRLNDITDPVVKELLEKFQKNGVHVVLKDFSQGMPLPTVAALAWDPATLGKSSEIVFTAGAASSPAKAAVRALTEVAQLGGDFETGACYEASGLTKYNRLEDVAWLCEGEEVSLSSLPCIEQGDIKDEVLILCKQLSDMGYSYFSVDTTNPEVGVSANYSFVPGFKFRERDRNACLGLFIGRMLTEEGETGEALAGLELLEEIYPHAHFTAFFKGMLALRLEDYAAAAEAFAAAEPLQPDNDAKALSAFYSAYCRTLYNDWEGALPFLTRAVELCPEMKEYLNLRGVSYFKLKNYEAAAQDFSRLLRELDKGSALDHANLGLCYKHLGRKVEAMEHLAAALDIDSSIDFARNALAELRAEARAEKEVK